MIAYSVQLREYGWYQGEGDTCYLIGIFTSKEKLEKALDELYVKHGSPVHAKIGDNRLINGTWYHLRGSADIAEITLDKIYPFGP